MIVETQDKVWVIDAKWKTPKTLTEISFADISKLQRDFEIRKEFILDLTPVVAGDFRWNLLTNFTAYENTVDQLAEGIERLNLGGFRVNIVAEEGQSYPTMLGSAYARDPQTNQIVVDSRQTLPNGNPNPQYGMPLRSSQQINYLGRVIPDFEFGFINKFTYKFLSLDIQVDWRQGGKIASGSNRLGKLYGRSLPMIMHPKTGLNWQSNPTYGKTKSLAFPGRSWTSTGEKGKAMLISPTMSEWSAMPLIYVPLD